MSPLAHDEFLSTFIFHFSVPPPLQSGINLWIGHKVRLVTQVSSKLDGTSDLNDIL